MPTKPATPRKFRQIYIKWNRCVETGRKLGVMLVVYELYVVVRVRREYPESRDWPGILINWGEHCLMDSTGWGIKIRRWWNHMPTIMSNDDGMVVEARLSDGRAYYYLADLLGEPTEGGWLNREDAIMRLRGDGPAPDFPIDGRGVPRRPDQVMLFAPFVLAARGRKR
jgi:hypothetical protein